jgi:hypothetical protein
MTLSLKASIAAAPLIGVLALSLAAGAAFAQPGAGGDRGAALKAACAADFQKHCPNVQMGPDMRKCVRTNFSSLSDGCKSVLKQLRSARQDHPQGGAAPAAPQ